MIEEKTFKIIIITILIVTGGIYIYHVVKVNGKDYQVVRQLEQGIDALLNEEHQKSMSRISVIRSNAWSQGWPNSKLTQTIASLSISPTLSRLQHEAEA